MRYIAVYISATLLALTTGCVPNRKVTLLQHTGDATSHAVVLDSALRSYGIVSEDYRIQPHDLLSIKFESVTLEGFDFLNADRQIAVGSNVMANAPLIGELVDDNGEVSFPVIGKIRVEGLTVFEAQETLREVAERYLESPVVKVRLLNFRFSVLGEVVREGTISFPGNRISILEAIGLAGGLGELADRSRVKLIRQHGDSVEVQYLNLLDEQLVVSPYYYLHQNDVLIVPGLRQRPFRKYFGQNLSLVVSTLSLLLLALNLTR